MRDSEKEGFCILDQRDAGKEGFRRGGMQDRRDAGYEGCRTGGMQDQRGAGQE